MKKIIGLAILLTISLLQSRDVSAQELPCRSGGICAAICNRPEGEQTYFYDFIHVNGIDGFFLQIVQEKPGLSGDTLIHESGKRLSEVDSGLGDLFEKLLPTIKKVDTKRPGKKKSPPKLTKEKPCYVRPVAVYSRKREKYVLDSELFNKMNPTGQAGVMTQAVMQAMAREKNLSPEAMVTMQRLTRRLSMTDEDAKKLAVDYLHEPIAPSHEELNRGIRNLLVVFSQAPADLPANGAGGAPEAKAEVKPDQMFHKVEKTENKSL